jgi:ubiquinone/menaquinone biosynthesis C-methylase UbiE
MQDPDRTLLSITFKWFYRMGFILDFDSFPLYEKFLQDPTVRSLDEFVEEIVLSELTPQRNDKVLDIGCGTGNSLLLLNKLGLDLTGIDASPYMIEIATRRLGNKCELIEGPAEDLPFSDNEFDFALLINTLEFLDDPVAALKEAGRVARKKVLICIVNSLSLFYLSGRIQGVFHETLLNQLKPCHLLKMKSCIREAYGSVPVVWKCKNHSYLPNQGNSAKKKGGRVSCKWPFASILGFCVTLRPLVRTMNMPLKIAVNKIEQPFADGITTQSDIHFDDNNPMSV